MEPTPHHSGIVDSEGQEISLGDPEVGAEVVRPLIEAQAQAVARLREEVEEQGRAHRAWGLRGRALREAEGRDRVRLFMEYNKLGSMYAIAGDKEGVLRTYEEADQVWPRAIADHHGVMTQKSNALGLLASEHRSRLDDSEKSSLLEAAKAARATAAARMNFVGRLEKHYGHYIPARHWWRPVSY